MSVFTYDKLYIKSGSFGLQNLEDLHMSICPNAHACLKFSGVMYSDKKLADLKEAIADTVVSLMGFDDSGQELAEPLFRGVVQMVHVIKENSYYHIEAEAVSGTQKLDHEKKSRSFQDMHMTYRTVVETVLQDTEAAGVVFEAAEADVPIEKPLIQYEETDWEFIRRLASRLNIMLIPNFLTSNPVFYFGMKKGRQEAVFDEEKYRMKMDRLYYTSGGAETGKRRGDYLYYLVDSEENYDIGCRCVYKDLPLFICKKEAAMKKGQLNFTYCLGRVNLIRLEKYYNDKICGMTLPGVVLATEKELVKLHLYIDAQQDVNTAYFYQWVPKTGNLMYCMPEVGSNVSLYMCDRDEQSAVIIDNIRVNGDACPNLEVFNNRFLTTKYQKRFYTSPTGMGVISDTKSDLGLHMQMDDYSGIRLGSHKEIDIQADEQIDIQAPSVSFTAPLQITLHQAAASLEINNLFNIFANTGIIEGPKPKGNSIAIDMGGGSSSAGNEKPEENKLGEVAAAEEESPKDKTEPGEIAQRAGNKIGAVTANLMQSTGLKCAEEAIQTLSHHSDDLPEQEEQKTSLVSRKKFDWCEQAGTVLANSVISGGKEKLAELFASTCGSAGAAGAMFVINAASVGTAKIPAMVLEQIIAGIQVNPGSAMAGCAQRASIASVPGATLAINPALPAMLIKSLKDRAMANFMKAAVVQIDYAIKPYKARVINRGCFGGMGKPGF